MHMAIMWLSVCITESSYYQRLLFIGDRILINEIVGVIIMKWNSTWTDLAVKNTSSDGLNDPFVKERLTAGRGGPVGVVLRQF